MERLAPVSDVSILKEVVWTEAPQTTEKPKTRPESWVMQVHRDFQKAPEDVRAIFSLEEKNYFKRMSAFRKYQRGEILVPSLIKPLIKSPEFNNYWGGDGPENKIVFQRALAEIEKNKTAATESSEPTEQPRPEIELLSAEQTVVLPVLSSIKRATSKDNDSLFETISAGITNLFTKAQSYVRHSLA